MPKVFWLRFPSKAIRDRTLPVLALGVLAHLLDWCDSEGTINIPRAALHRIYSGLRPLLRRHLFVTSLHHLREREYLQGGMGKGVTLLCYPAAAEIKRTPRSDRKKEKKKPPLTPPAGGRADACASLNGERAPPGWDRPESRVLHGLTLQWGHRPQYALRMLARASGAVVAYALAVNRKRLRQNVGRPWAYLRECLKGKLPCGEDEREARKRIDKERGSRPDAPRSDAGPERLGEVVAGMKGGGG